MTKKRSADEITLSEGICQRIVTLVLVILQNLEYFFSYEKGPLRVPLSERLTVERQLFL